MDVYASPRTASPALSSASFVSDAFSESGYERRAYDRHGKTLSRGEAIPPKVEEYADEKSDTKDEEPESLEDAKYKHEQFYFTDGSVTFLIEETLYKVHLSLLEKHSSTFAEVAIGARIVGDAPLLLEGVESVAFDQFLSVIYRSDFIRDDPETVEQWEYVLALSTRWGFKSVRELAITKLSEITTSVDRVVFGRLYDIPHWLVPAYTNLCMRVQPLHIEEGRRLGIDDVIGIGEIRYERDKHRGGSHSPRPVSPTETTDEELLVTSLVTAKFMPPPPPPPPPPPISLREAPPLDTLDEHLTCATPSRSGPCLASPCSESAVPAVITPYPEFVTADLASSYPKPSDIVSPADTPTTSEPSHVSRMGEKSGSIMGKKKKKGK